MKKVATIVNAAAAAIIFGGCFAEKTTEVPKPIEATELSTEANVTADLNETIRQLNKYYNIDDSRSKIDTFLQKYDEKSIEKKKTDALVQDSKNRTILEGLPPKTPDLFASGLYMPYEDDAGIYHDYDHIYFKVRNGKWDLDSVKEKGERSSFVFTKEAGAK